MVTADHGQVEVGDNCRRLHPDVLAHVSFQSGEGRFRWLHARPGRPAALLEAAEAHHGDTGWVRTREQTIDEGWWGPQVTDAAAPAPRRRRPRRPDAVSFVDPADTGPFELIGRHGSLTVGGDARAAARRTTPGGA